MSFHPRQYYEEHEEYFPTAEFKEYLASENLYDLVKEHLIKNPDQKIERGNLTGLSPDDVEKLCDWQHRFPDWLENKKFEKWITFLMDEQLKKFEARKLHLDQKNYKGKWSHAKINTMKVFFNDRDEEPRDPEKEEKFNIFIYFIKQMSNEITSRYFDKSIKERVFNLRGGGSLRGNSSVLFWLFSFLFRNLNSGTHLAQQVEPRSLFLFSPGAWRRKIENLKARPSRGAE